MLAVVLRLKTDTHTITKKGGKFASSVDGRLCVQCRPGAFRVNTNFTIQVCLHEDIYYNILRRVVLIVLEETKTKQSSSLFNHQIPTLRFVPCGPIN